MSKNDFKKTQIIKANPNQPEPKIIKIAGEVIIRGGLVVLPTDTVYGLVCDATNAQAVKKVYQVKKRPLSIPLLIAVSSVKDIAKYVRDIPAQAKILAKKFLPGALTLVLKKSSIIPDIVTAGRTDIGIRIPDCKLVLQLIRYTKRPLVIPSANIHNRPSPITAQQAIEDLSGKVDLIIDGGKTKHGIESTIVSISNNKIEIIREGAISYQTIKNYLNRIKKK
ncbi:MAG: L-threonylcarbamoyladenylate synthase [candidate division WOR-3 bacterium]|nr:L-threonylcarbamoyladenylate synthase [candidate division WOR-3 bacterium]